MKDKDLVFSVFFFLVVVRRDFKTVVDRIVKTDRSLV